MGNNAGRGCGHKKPGRCYGESDSGPGGILSRWTWALDSGAQGRDLMYLDGIPDQGQLAINPRLSLWRGEVITYDQGLVIEKEQGVHDIPLHLVRLGNYALLDHVGESHYPAAWDFAMETIRLGPSRVIPQSNAVEASKHTPFPIFFAHKVPLFESPAAAERFIVEALDSEPNLYRFGASYLYPDWGLEVSDWDGYDTRGDTQRAQGLAQYLTEVLKGLAQGIVYDGYRMRKNALIGASWITKITFYDDKPTKLPERFKGGKIRTAVIDPPE